MSWDLHLHRLPLRDVLKDAIRYTDDPQRKIEFETIVDHAMDVNHLTNLLEVNALTMKYLIKLKSLQSRKKWKKIEARKLQPHFIESFLLLLLKSCVVVSICVRKDVMKLCEYL